MVEIGLRPRKNLPRSDHGLESITVLILDRGRPWANTNQMPFRPFNVITLVQHNLLFTRAIQLIFPLLNNITTVTENVCLYTSIVLTIME